MKRIIISVLVAVALLTSGVPGVVVVSQDSVVGIAYAGDGDGGY